MARATEKATARKRRGAPSVAPAATKSSRITDTRELAGNAKRGATAAVAAKVSKSERPPAAPAPAKLRAVPAPAASAPSTAAKASVSAPLSRSEDLKARFAALSGAAGQIAGMKRSLAKNFFEIGEVLNRIRDERLYEVKGYGSFDAFVEREIDVNKVVCHRMARVAQTMQRAAAIQAGFERCCSAMAALDGEDTATTSPLRSSSAMAPIVPLHKQ